MTRQRKTVIHVNQHVIARNRKTGSTDPATIVRDYEGSTPASRVRIEGPPEIVNSYLEPLSCGARVWIETRSPVTIME